MEILCKRASNACKIFVSYCGRIFGNCLIKAVNDDTFEYFHKIQFSILASDHRSWTWFRPIVQSSRFCLMNTLYAHTNEFQCR